MFDAYLAERASTGYLPSTPPRTITRMWTAGKREDGVRSFLSSRAIEIPDGSPDDPGAADGVWPGQPQERHVAQAAARRWGLVVLTGRGAT